MKHKSRKIEQSTLPNDLAELIKKSKTKREIARAMRLFHKALKAMKTKE